MKILKKTAAAILTILLVALTACGDTSIPEGMDEGELFNAGKDVILLLVKGEYETVHMMLRQDQRALFTAEDIADVVTAQLSSAGEYKQITDHVITGQTIRGERYAIVTLYCEFAKADVLVRITFDTDLYLVGFSLEQK